MQHSFLIVGLGNPGKKYEGNRHNAGFLILDKFKKEFFPYENWKEKYKGLVITSMIQKENYKIPCILLKPMTYMNLSGKSVCECLKKENIPLKNTIILHDEIELPFGIVKLKEGGGHRGHNGLRNIMELCGSEFFRIRIGVGRPKDESTSVANFLLSDFTTNEKNRFIEIYENIRKIILSFLEESLTQKNKI